MSIYGLADCNPSSCPASGSSGQPSKAVPPSSCRRIHGCIVTRSDDRQRRSASRWRSRRQAKDLIERHSIAAHQRQPPDTDMSNRVMQAFDGTGSAVEKYSIDECFLDLTGMPQELTAFCQGLKHTVRQWTEAADQHRHRRDQDPCQDSQPSREDLRQNERCLSISPVSAGATGRWCQLKSAMSGASAGSTPRNSTATAS